MKDTISSTFILLVTLTLMLTFLVYNVNPEIIITTVVVLAFIKFWLVVFQFMKMNTTHPFWKYLTLSFGGLLALILITSL